MPTEIKIPAVGESITEVTIAKWLKQDGDAVKRDEVIAELESDKATFELPAEADGTLKILVAEGETIGIGTAIAQLDGAGSAAPASAPAAASAPAPAAAASADPLAKGEENPTASDQSGYGGTPA
ncbi:MAG: biotin/lipoyl-containing protein, partial [Janthinobacterium lividum]